MSNQYFLQNFNEINSTYCIYQIKCKISNKVYIGSTQNFRLRIAHHIDALKNNKHHNRHLQNAFNCYGIENFYIEILQKFQYCENKSKNKCSKTTMRQILEKAEQEQIEKADKQYLYNTSLQTKSFFFGCKHSEESKQKIRMSRLKKHYLRGKTFEEYFGIEKSNQLKKEISKNWTPWKTRKHHTVKSREKMSKRRKGILLGPCSSEHKLKLSISNIGKHNHNGINNPMFGKPGAFTGKIWIHKDDIEKPIFLDKLELFTSQGWKKG